MMGLAFDEPQFLKENDLRLSIVTHGDDPGTVSMRFHFVFDALLTTG